MTDDQTEDVTGAFASAIDSVRIRDSVSRLRDSPTHQGAACSTVAMGACLLAVFGGLMFVEVALERIP